jgi:hypothetical protein
MLSAIVICLQYLLLRARQIEEYRERGSKYNEIVWCVIDKRFRGARNSVIELGGRENTKKFPGTPPKFLSLAVGHEKQPGGTRSASH